MIAPTENNEANNKKKNNRVARKNPNLRHRKGKDYECFFFNHRSPISQEDKPGEVHGGVKSGGHCQRVSTSAFFANVEERSVSYASNGSKSNIRPVRETMSALPLADMRKAENE